MEAPRHVAYLGPEGTFTEEAAIKHFGRLDSALPCASIDEVFRRVEANEAAYGVVPVENSTEGAVGRTLDGLLRTTLKICAEITLRIRQNLLRKSPGIEGARVLYSHVQSLAQCHRWLEQNLPGIERTPVLSNAEAARRAAADPAALAIAGAAAAQRYQLTVLARSIEDEPDNTTRFLALGSRDTAPTGRDKTSLVMSTRNCPGAMVTLLRPLSRNGVSLTKLESRPSREGLWEYVFFADIEGHESEPRVARALAELRERAALLKVLGSYPMAPLEAAREGASVRRLS
jgi:chorismate mutase / prephenate dehydratase